jgi:hypothetical protein
MPAYCSVLILLVFAWGAFGAVYSWAFTPLFWAADRGFCDASRHEGLRSE